MSDAFWPHNTIMPLTETFAPHNIMLQSTISAMTAKEDGKVIGYTFHAGDLFHVGHLHQLLQCRKHCDYLIVGVLTDRAIASYKKEPVIPYPWRARIYEALRCVDEVLPQNSRDPTDNLRLLQPDILFHGDDWEDFPGKEYMESIEAVAIQTPYFHGISTSSIIEQIQAQVTKQAWGKYEKPMVGTGAAAGGTWSEHRD